MKTFSFLFTVCLFLFVSSCKKLDSTEDRIAGEWKIKSVKEQNNGIGLRAITPTLGYKKLVFKANHTLELHLNNLSVLNGTWEFHYEEYSYTDPQTGNPVYASRPVIDFGWSQEVKYMDRNFLDLVNRKKLKFSDMENRVYFECEK
ncbi:MAG TPA: hypothetical protein VD905_19440 [Flavobacteriales bacterium]|nr:hypothetical protein [Flavobacteriales bacterium]